VPRLPRRGISPRRFIGPPPLSLALRGICNMKTVRLAFPIAFGFPKRRAVAPGLEIGSHFIIGWTKGSSQLLTRSDAAARSVP